MGCPEASFIAFAFLCVVLTIMVISIKWGSTPTSSGFFKEWHDLFTARRNARNREEKRWIFWLAVSHTLRGGGWGVIGVTAAAGFPRLLESTQI